MNKSKIGILVSAVLATSAWANTNNDPEVITVIGQKLERTLQDTSESIAVVTDDMIEVMPLFQFQDIFNQTANAYDFGNGENFGIRGITQNSAATGGGSGAMGTLYIDGVAYTGFANRFGPKELWDLQQVEILRGPQSTNAGRNALAGAIVVQTKRPVIGETEGAIRVDGGNDGHQSVEGMINLPVADNMALRLTAQYDETDGYMENVTLGDDDYDARRNRTIRGQFLIEPSDDLAINVMGQYAKSERGQDIYRADLTGLESRQSSANLVAQEHYDAYSAAINIDYRFNDSFNLDSITSYIKGDYDRFDDDDEGPEGGNAFRGRTAEDKNWAQELRLNYRGDHAQGVIGLYYTEVDLTNNTTGLINLAPAALGVPSSLLPFYPGLLEVNVLQPYDGETQNVALFTEWDYYLTDNITINAGLRFDHEKQQYTTAVMNSLAPGSSLPDPVAAGKMAEMLQPGSGALVEAGVTQVNQVLASLLVPVVNPEKSVDYNALLPQLGITYKFSDDLSLSAFYKRGYRAGGVELNAAGTRSKYDPEYLNNFEIALRSVWLDGDLTFNANAYFGDWTDQQVTRCIDGSTINCVTENAGESEIYGAELELSYNPNEDLMLFANLGLSKNEFKNFVIEDGSTQTDYSGNRFAFSPELSATVSGRYFVTDKLYVGTTVSFQNDSYADFENTAKLESRTLVDLSAGHFFNDNIKLDAYITNLTDEFYLTTNTPGLDGNSWLVRAGEPREYGARISYQF